VKSKMVDELSMNNVQNPHLNNPSTTTKIRTALKNLFIARNFNEKKPMSKEKETFSTPDALCLVLICILSKDRRLAMFALYVISLVQFAGRASETAKVWFRHITMYNPPEFPNPAEKIASTNLFRDKTKHEQDLSIFGHRCHFLLDWYFLLGYTMIMNEGNVEEAVFPDYYRKAVEDEAQRAQKKKSASQASGFFKTQFQSVHNLFMDYTGRLNDHQAARQAEGLDDDDNGCTYFENLSLNPGLSSHSGKRYSVNMADMNPFVKFTWLSMRAGWLMKGFHTVFDYLVGNNRFTDRQAALSTSGWMVTENGLIGGGRPPMLQPITRNDPVLKAQMVLFKSFLFFHYSNIEGANSSDLQDLILATILKDLPAMINLLLSHPLHDFGNNEEEVWSKHPFLERLKSSAADAGIPDLLQWSKTIHDDWVLRNYAYIPMNQLVELGETNHTVDPRTITAALTTIQQRTAGVQATLETMGREHISVHNTVITVRKQLEDDAIWKTSINFLLAEQSREVAELRSTLAKFLWVQTNMVSSVILPVLTGNNNGQPPQHIIELIATMEQLTISTVPTVNETNVPPTNAHANPPAPPPVYPPVIPPLVPPRGVRRVAPAARTDGLSKIPELFGNCTVISVFKAWFVNEWYKDIANPSSNIRSFLLSAMGYFWLFLPRAVPPLLPGQDPRSPLCAPWRNQIDEIAAEGWEEYKKFWRRHFHPKPLSSSKVTSFKKNMASPAITSQMIIDISIGRGDPIPDCFQSQGKSRPIPSKATIVATKVLQDASEAEKRRIAAAQDAMDQS
jgi:hypothetical protein